jgi:hypothetical protein
LFGDQSLKNQKKTQLYFFYRIGAEVFRVILAGPDPRSSAKIHGKKIRGKKIRYRHSVLS